MRKVAKYLTIPLILVAGAWLGIGSFSDPLVGNRKMQDETPTCDDPTFCAQLRDEFIVDAHNDTLLHRDPSLKSAAGHSDLARLAAAGVDLQIFAVASLAPKIETQDGKPCGDLSAGDRLNTYFILKEPLRPATWLSPMRRVDRMIERFDAAMGQQQEGAVLTKVSSKADLDALVSDRANGLHKVGAVLAIEGAYWASDDPSELKAQFDRLEAAGVRMIGLTHRSSNQLAGSSEDCTDRHGLTELGRIAVAEIWQRGMILDLAHASSQTIADVTSLATEGERRPIVVSHTGINAACRNDRNLSEKDLRNIVRAGGVVSIGFWTTVNCFEGSVRLNEARQAIARSFGAAYEVMNAPEFVAEMGPGFDASEHLALGSDFDGATLVPADAAAIPWYLEGIAQFSDGGTPVFDRDDLENIAGKNLQRFLGTALSEG